jgi:hypothetical protein
MSAMTRTISYLPLVFAVLAWLAVPGTAHAGAMIKEHDCVGNDLTVDLIGEGQFRVPQEDAPDAGCTPPGSVITPGPGVNVYGIEDTDDLDGEAFVVDGAIEHLSPNPADPLAPTGKFSTLATEKGPALLVVGQPARFQYDIAIKAPSVMTDIEVICSVCAEAPQGLGPRQTFTRLFDFLDDPQVSGSGEFFDNAHLNLDQEPWRMAAVHRRGGVQQVAAQHVTIPGLRFVSQFESSEVTFMGCKPTTLLLENTGEFRMNDTVRVTILVPQSARTSATMDVTSCEISYIRGCRFNEGVFKDICIGEP